jgi:APA family basic amino acid/polyamine antiporter
LFRQVDRVYFQSLLKGFGISLPAILTTASGTVPRTKTWFNFPAFLIIMIITFFLIRRVKVSERVNNIMVIIKIAVVVLFIIVGIGYVKPVNWANFLPFGFNGIFTAAAVIFTVFIGFDAVVSATEESRNPAKDLPKGILFYSPFRPSCPGLFLSPKLKASLILSFCSIPTRTGLPVLLT